jgi:hypothetical protein
MVPTLPERCIIVQRFCRRVSYESIADDDPRQCQHFRSTNSENGPFYGALHQWWRFHWSKKCQSGLDETSFFQLRG